MAVIIMRLSAGLLNPACVDGVPSLRAYSKNQVMKERNALLLLIEARTFSDNFTLQAAPSSQCWELAHTAMSCFPFPAQVWLYTNWRAELLSLSSTSSAAASSCPRSLSAFTILLACCPSFDSMLRSVDNVFFNFAIGVPGTVKSLMQAATCSLKPSNPLQSLLSSMAVNAAPTMSSLILLRDSFRCSATAALPSSACFTVAAHTSSSVGMRFLQCETTLSVSINNSSTMVSTLCLPFLPSFSTSRRKTSSSLFFDLFATTSKGSASTSSSKYIAASSAR
mmetsp:Transcript_40284/g.106347  ORF Transcript_40284/g.106347 Transcript_40284/m.106347 type:complete len:280 (+) Transcript_40284:215-1054(+)